MGYLYMGVVLAVWTVLAFVYRWADSRKANRFTMAMAIGLAGVVWTLLYVLVRHVDLRPAHPSQFIIGCGMGVLGVIGIPLFMAAVARGDLSITWTVLTLSFALASLLAIVYPGEKPTVPGVMGLVAAAVAVTLLGLDMVERHRGGGPGKPRQGWLFFMSLSFITNGVTLYGYSLANAFLPDKAVVHRVAFFLVMYGVFALGGLVLVLLTRLRAVALRRAKARRTGSVGAGLVMGSLVGTLLLVGGALTLVALNVAGVPGYVLYPATSGGSSILVVVLSVVFLKERPGRFGWMGIAAGTTALVLLGVAA